MQSVSSRIWTRVAVSISYDDNDYTTGTSIKLLMAYVCMRAQGCMRCDTSALKIVKHRQFIARNFPASVIVFSRHVDRRRFP